jgi:hypothetical protein
MLAYYLLPLLVTNYTAAGLEASATYQLVDLSGPTVIDTQTADAFGIVRFVDQSDITHWRIIKSGSGVDDTPPSPPANLTGNFDFPYQVDLSWTASTDDVSEQADLIYIVERSTDGSTYVTAGVTVPGAVNYLDGGLQPSTDYWYRVKAEDEATPPNQSDYSNVAQGTTNADVSESPIPVSAIWARADPTDVDNIYVTWLPGFDPDGPVNYQIHETTNDVSSGWYNSTVLAAYITDAAFGPGETLTFEVIVRDSTDQEETTVNPTWDCVTYTEAAVGAGAQIGGLEQTQYVVTSSSDDNIPGTLRWALTGGETVPLYITFDLAADDTVITVASDRLRVDTNVFPLTIDGTLCAGGQPIIHVNAPTGGLNIFTADEGLVLRNLVFEDDLDNRSPLIFEGAQNILVDHCVMRGGYYGMQDNGTSFNAATFQHSMFYDAGRIADGSVSYDLSFYQCLFSGGTVEGFDISATNPSGALDFVNNVLYDWTLEGLDIASDGRVNLVNNVVVYDDIGGTQGTGYVWAATNQIYQIGTAYENGATAPAETANETSALPMTATITPLSTSATLAGVIANVGTQPRLGPEQTVITDLTGDTSVDVTPPLWPDTGNR